MFYDLYLALVQSEKTFLSYNATENVRFVCCVD